MDRATVEIYEREAQQWEARRRPNALAELRRFARRLPRGVVADLGSGPGWYAADLRSPVVAVDAAAAMLDRVRSNAPGALALHADLEGLPFRRGSLAGAWARNSYVHVRREAVPLALADLHRSLVLGAPVTLVFFAGTGDGTAVFPDDDFPGRYFSLWATDHLRDVVHGAGFEIDGLVETDHTLIVRATRARRLADTVGPDMHLLLVGLNPSLFAADAGIGFARPGNRFWPAAQAAGIVTRARDPRHALLVDRVGMTDLVKRATVAAAELDAAEFAEGLGRVERLAAWLQPRAVCFLGLSGWRAAVDRKAVAGIQPRRLGDRPVYVMPNPSGLNARAQVPDLGRHLAAASKLAGQQ